jgi:hypothetical protein
MEEATTKHTKSTKARATAACRTAIDLESQGNARVVRIFSHRVLRTACYRRSIPGFPVLEEKATGPDLLRVLRDLRGSFSRSEDAGAPPLARLADPAYTAGGYFATT